MYVYYRAPLCATPTKQVWIPTVVAAAVTASLIWDPSPTPIARY